MASAPPGARLAEGKKLCYWIEQLAQIAREEFGHVTQTNPIWHHDCQSLLENGQLNDQSDDRQAQPALQESADAAAESIEIDKIQSIDDEPCDSLSMLANFAVQQATAAASNSKKAVAWSCNVGPGSGQNSAEQTRLETGKLDSKQLRLKIKNFAEQMQTVSAHDLRAKKIEFWHHLQQEGND